MLYLGKSIITPGDPLQPVEVERIYKATLNPKGSVAEQLAQLRQIRMIDPNKYRKMKTRLPYLVCARFHPLVRRKENFMDTECFLIDLDHLADNGLELNTLRSRLRLDPRVEFLFSSPSGDGLKILFHLEEKITDAAYYAQFYKAFCLKLNEEYRLGASVDTKTNDVSRCCFVAFDPEAYFNPTPEKIAAERILSSESFKDLDHVNRVIKELEKEHQSNEKAEQAQVLPDDVLANIKLKVGQRVRKPKEKQYFQPEELQSLLEEIRPVIQSVGAELEKSSPINYGRVLRIKAGNYWAELNLFYGHRGARVVKTTKTGSNKELTEGMFQLLRGYFEDKSEGTPDHVRLS